jgi:hypothetical protein
MLAVREDPHDWQTMIMAACTRGMALNDDHTRREGVEWRQTINNDESSYSGAARGYKGRQQDDERGVSLLGGGGGSGSGDGRGRGILVAAHSASNRRTERPR